MRERSDNASVGLIVHSLQDARHEKDAANTDAYRDEVLTKLAAVEARLQRMEG